ncbi:MAG: hypothetical protein QG608_1442 [Actinomycetota bacterium]|nr:hypothetical protein [Actinomycetota bacterium]
MNTSGGSRWVPPWRVADQVMVLAQGESSGVPRVGSVVLGALVGAGLLGELVVSGNVVVGREGRVAVVREGAPSDALAHEVLAELLAVGGAGGRGVGVGEWVGRLGGWRVCGGVWCGMGGGGRWWCVGGGLGVRWCGWGRWVRRMRCVVRRIWGGC